MFDQNIFSPEYADEIILQMIKCRKCLIKTYFLQNMLWTSKRKVALKRIFSFFLMFLRRFRK